MPSVMYAPYLAGITTDLYPGILPVYQECCTVWYDHCTPRKFARMRARFFRYAPKSNSDLCMAVSYVQVRKKRRLRCPDQPDPTDLTLTLTLTATQNPLGGWRFALEVGRGSIEFTCKSENLARTRN